MLVVVVAGRRRRPCALVPSSPGIRGRLIVGRSRSIFATAFARNDVVGTSLGHEL